MREPSPQQLMLDLTRSHELNLENFVVGRNAEVVHALRRLRDSAPREGGIYLWGASGAGRTHLLRAVVFESAARYWRCGAPTDLPQMDNAANALAWEPSIEIWAIDDVHLASADEQLALFQLINELRTRVGAVRPSAIVLAGDAPPLQLALREDLRTRLGWGLVFQLHSLDDAEKDAALTRHAEARGVMLPSEVRRYLLTNFSRDMGTLVALAETLEAYAIERQRALTLPLVREFTQQLALDQQNTLALDPT